MKNFLIYIFISNMPLKFMDRGIRMTWFSHPGCCKKKKIVRKLRLISVLTKLATILMGLKLHLLSFSNWLDAWGAFGFDISRKTTLSPLRPFRVTCSGTWAKKKKQTHSPIISLCKVSWPCLPCAPFTVQSITNCVHAHNRDGLLQLLKSLK